LAAKLFLPFLIIFKDMFDLLVAISLGFIPVKGNSRLGKILTIVISVVVLVLVVVTVIRDSTF